MAYETLVNACISVKPANKPNYTPTKSFKRALKVLRKFFKKSTQKHQKFLNESIFETSMIQEAEYACDSDEECDNMANERREAAAANTSNN